MLSAPRAERLRTRLHRLARRGAVVLARARRRGTAAPPPLPARLTDQEFWRLSDLSEPRGSSGPTTSSRTSGRSSTSCRRSSDATRPGGVYLGVAPDQNFTYIVALAPAMAFIVDIRRGNLLQHLMYKALIELSADRADFLSRLFSKPRPPNLGPIDAWRSSSRRSTASRRARSTTRRTCRPSSAPDQETRLRDVGWRHRAARKHLLGVFLGGPGPSLLDVAAGSGGRRGTAAGFRLTRR